MRDRFPSEKDMTAARKLARRVSPLLASLMDARKTDAA